jgi:hypothetical protein
MQGGFFYKILRVELAGDHCDDSMIPSLLKFVIYQIDEKEYVHILSLMQKEKYPPYLNRHMIKIVSNLQKMYFPKDGMAFWGLDLYTLMKKARKDHGYFDILNMGDA